MPAPAPERFGAYLLLGGLGRGGLAQSYVARVSRADQRLFALKVYDKSALQLLRFRENAQRAASLLPRLQHPNLVTIDELGTQDEHPFALAALIRAIDAGRIESAVPARIATRVLLDLLAALVFLHGRSVVHGHLSLRDVLLGLDGVSRLADAGIVSLLLQDRSNDPRQLVARPEELAPEIVAGSVPTAASDIFGAAQVTRALLGELNSDFSPSLKQLFTRWLDPDPERRPQSAELGRGELMRATDDGRSIGGASEVAAWLKANLSVECQRIEALFERSQVEVVEGFDMPVTDSSSDFSGDEASTAGEWPAEEQSMPTAKHEPLTDKGPIPTVPLRQISNNFSPTVRVEPPLWDTQPPPQAVKAPRGVNVRTAVLDDAAEENFRPVPAPATLPPARRLGRFTLGNKIADGGMADVYRATQEGPDGARECVVKLIMPQFAQNPEYVGMFAEEARISRQLHHPNIVTCLEAGEVEGTPYIAFELIDGIDLAALYALLAPARLPLGVVLQIGAQVALALDYAHRLLGGDGKALELVHRDVSPQNVLIARSGAVKLLDFGISRFRDRRHATRVGVVKGKLSYLAPEQLAGGVIDARTDVFQLGLVLIEALCGEGVPLIQAPSKLAGLVEVPEGLRTLLASMIAADPKARPASANQVATELQAFLAQLAPQESLPTLLARYGISTPSPTLPPPAPLDPKVRDTAPTLPRTPPFRLWWLWLVALAVALGVALGWALQR